MRTNVSTLKGKTIAFAASGGLDSCTITRWLTEAGVNVVCITADMAQPDESNFDEVRQRMLACGAKSATQERREPVHSHAERGNEGGFAKKNRRRV